MLEVMQDVNRKLGVIIAFLAEPVEPSTGMNLREKIRLLDSRGLRPGEIADILHRTPNYVSKELTLMRKEKT